MRPRGRQGWDPVDVGARALAAAILVASLGALIAGRTRMPWEEVSAQPAPGVRYPVNFHPATEAELVLLPEIGSVTVRRIESWVEVDSL